jgi:hypothetical protein
MDYGINSYEGTEIGTYNGFVMTESNFRPACFRFEASEHNGDPSLGASTEAELRSEIDEASMRR